MRTVLMSFKTDIYEKIKRGEKIFEYRRQYSNDETIVYMYVSSPTKAITGIVHLGKRIDLTSWEEDYFYDKAVLGRIKKYKEKYKYAMPILSFQDTNSISLKQLQDNINNFIVPQSYYYLDRNNELLSYLNDNIECLSEKKYNAFDNALPFNICLSYD